MKKPTVQLIHFYNGSAILPEMMIVELLRNFAAG